MDLYRIILIATALLVFLYGFCSSGLYEGFDDAMSGGPDAFSDWDVSNFLHGKPQPYFLADDEAPKPTPIVVDLAAPTAGPGIQLANAMTVDPMQSVQVVPVVAHPSVTIQTA